MVWEPVYEDMGSVSDGMGPVDEEFPIKSEGFGEIRILF